MKEAKRGCFIIMPFVPELHYFYLYLKQYLEQVHNIRCERADAQVLTKPILDKINDYIRNSDVIIADCSGRNPNVFYELGLAHALKYELDKHIEFLKKMDNALHNVFFERYENLFKIAMDIFNEFKRETQAQVSIVNEEVFSSRVMAAERTQDLPSMEDDKAVMAFVLPRIIADSTDVAIMNQIINWLEKNNV